MPSLTYVHPDGTKQSVEVPAGKRIMQAAIGAGIDGIVAECGGQAMCATCHVYIDSAWADRLHLCPTKKTRCLTTRCANVPLRVDCHVRFRSPTISTG